MKRFLLFTVAVITALTIQAQHKITGKVVDKQSGETLPGVTVKLLKTDSTMVKGVLTDEDGHFDVTTDDGRDIVQLTSNAGNNEHPTWSPDGKLIAFSSNRSGSYQIYIMRKDGSNVTRITNSGENTSPTWSFFYDDFKQPKKEGKK